MIIKTASLTPPLLKIIRDKGTEIPFTVDYKECSGTYLCRQCGVAVYRSATQFNSSCGWPSFDMDIPGTVITTPDSDGIRQEIVCARCHAHFGHVFFGEGFTHKNTRHCVNSMSLDFCNSLTVDDSDEAIFAGGCFWGVEYLFKKLTGVIFTEVGYSGGDELQPNYSTVSSHKTGHAEALRVLYDRKLTNFKTVAQYFFEIHDSTQIDRQGPDIGRQYRSIAFFYDDEQKRILTSLIEELTNKGYQVATEVKPVSTFWPAEQMHQDYYAKTGKAPYCHRYEKRF